MKKHRTWMSLSVAALFVAALVLAIAAVPRTASAEMCLPEYTKETFAGYTGCCSDDSMGNPRIQKRYFRYKKTCTPNCTCTGWYLDSIVHTCRIDWSCAPVV